MKESLTLTLKKGYLPVIIYRVEDGNPILEDEEIILVDYPNLDRERYAPNNIRITFNGGPDYKFLRSKLLVGSYEDNTNSDGISKTGLSKEQYELLRSIVNERLLRLESKTLEEIANREVPVR